MAAVAKNPSFAKKVGISKSVGEEFMKADKTKKFGSGGMMDKKDIKQDKAMAKKAVGMHEKQLHGGKKSNLAALKKGGMAKKMAAGGSANMNKVGRTIPTSPSPWSSQSPKVNPGGAGKVYASGMAKKTTSDVNKVNPGGAGKVYASGMTKKMASGGCAKMARGGGIEKKGKTKGKMC